MPLNTVRVVSDDTDFGYVILNESDFDETSMTLYTEALAALPSIRDLAAHIATLSVEEIAALLSQDTRKSATAIYNARLAELAKA